MYHNLTFVNKFDGEELSQGYFQQDEARVHTANRTLNYQAECYDRNQLKLVRSTTPHRTLWKSCKKEYKLIAQVLENILIT